MKNVRLITMHIKEPLIYDICIKWQKQEQEDKVIERENYESIYDV